VLFRIAEKEDFKNLSDISLELNYEYINILTSITYADEKIGFLEIISDTNLLKERIIEQIMVSLVIVFISLIITVFLAFWFEKIFSKPIFVLLNAVQQIKNRSNFDIKLVSNTKDEFHILITEFNRMTEEIHRRDKVLNEHNISLEQKVSHTSNELKKTQDHLHEVSILATTDTLTDLSNRRSTMDSFIKMKNNATSNNQPLGIIMLDIDHFKQVNDNLGHPAGDVVLKEVALILREYARERDVVGRIGGEEFLILCHNSDMSTTFNVAQRIRQMVEKKVIYYEKDKTTQVTISIGVHSEIPKKLSTDELMKTVDIALYKAKETGRNRIIKGICR